MKSTEHPIAVRATASASKASIVAKMILVALLAASISALALSGCAAKPDGKMQNAAVEESANASDKAQSATNGNTEGEAVESGEASQQDASADPYAPTEWDAEIAPDFYRVDGAAIVEHEISPGEFHFGDLDDLGRATACYAAITRDNYEDELEEEREDFGASADRISGWGHNVRIEVSYPSGDARSTWAFARSHLIADSLGGVVDNGAKHDGKSVATNLITGTYAQNVGSDNEGGMAYAETKARDWLSQAEDGEWLYYCATPVYQGDEPVVRSVFVDILSSDGELDEHIEVFNVVGDVSGRYSLDYATGCIIDNETGKALG